MQAIGALKQNQDELTQKLSDLTDRVTTVESLIEINGTQPPTSDIFPLVSNAVRIENAQINSRLNDLEDRSRRDNLLFYGVQDHPSETWAESEAHIRNLVSGHLNMALTDDAIARAHRLGAFVPNKTRPIIAKFSSFKSKENILSQKSKFKTAGVSVGEDFCRATRQSRKKLVEYGKASGQTYSLRADKLVINKKKYVYCAATDSVCEIDPVRNTSDPNDDENSTQVSTATHPRSS